MTTQISDKALKFPEFTLLKASAGSGKTHALSLRFVQFLLSDKIKRATRSELPNILAITFTKNAAKEMKARILDWLKECHFPEAQDPRKIKEILDIVSIAPDRLSQKAQGAIDDILSNYSDFQVETIDSFMATIFKTSSVDLGFSPDFEIVLDNTELVQYAFSRYLRKVTPHSEEGRVFRTILDHILANLREDAAFAWDPTPEVLGKLIVLYTKLAIQDRELKIENFGSERAKLRKQIIQTAEKLTEMLEGEGAGLARETRGHCHSKILPAIKERRFTDLMGYSFKSDPVKKPKSGQDVKIYEKILQSWRRLESLVDDHKSYYARDYYYPYLLAYQSFAGTLDEVKRRQGTVFIEDIGKQLSSYIKAGIVPDIYFRLGDRIFHYLIDEFQDTSRIQWRNLKPLIEESLSKNGSLFVVGDMKQAIYGFRDADYQIMMDLGKKKDGFPSVEVVPKDLTENYRSHEEVLNFVKKVFIKGKSKADETADEEKGRGEEIDESEQNREKDKYDSIARLSGLNTFKQDVIKEHRGSGYVEYVILEKDVDAVPEKAEIQKKIWELRQRGYSYSDIAILTYRNESVVEISSWLNEINVPFIPFSSLDIRKRKTIGEIIAFLRFLDSPPDDLSFSIFLLGDVMKKKMEQDGISIEPDMWHRFLFECQQKKDYPLYSAFRNHHAEFWGRYLEQFFKTVGYYPLSDLVTLIYRVYNVFELFPEEEAALTKLLEVIKDFEGMGRNDLGEFLEFTGAAEGQESAWTVDVPSEIDAVRVMSIHKAKGLGFQVVIFLAYGERFNPPEFFLDADEESVRVYKLNKGLMESDEDLTRIYEGTRTKDGVERLNRLYVALTRATAELHIIGVKGQRDTYPFDLLGKENFTSSPVKPAACPAPCRAESPRAEKMRVLCSFDLPPNKREALNYENIRRGEIAHKILAEVEFLRSGWDIDIPEIIQKISREEAEAPVFGAIGSSIIRYFQGSPLDDHFIEKEGRRVFREFNVCDARGGVYRMDRVVIDEDSVSIIDFKTGGESEAAKQAEWDEEDKEQVAAYIRIMKDIFPKKSVRGILAYIDRKKWEMVG
jgi:ATP-dependent exoDNAse (exonuclease V) beta subunit